MSWQAYVDNNLVGSGKISKAAIIGLQGGVWAASAGYDLTAEEQQHIVSGLTKDAGLVQSSGVRAVGNKFFTLQVTDRSIYGKKQADGIIIVKTTQAILVAEYENPIQAGEATPVVENLADYLISVGY